MLSQGKESKSEFFILATSCTWEEQNAQTTKINIHCICTFSEERYF